MKKIYEKPMVELTKFDVEDIITASGIVVDTSSLSNEEKNAITDPVKTAGSYDAVGVYQW